MRVDRRPFTTRDGRRFEVASAGRGEAGAVLDHALRIHGRMAIDGDDLGRIFARLENAPDGLFLVARAGAQVVGTASLERGVVGISVREGWRRQGVGRRLLEAAVGRSRAGRLGRLELEVEPDNEAALALYRSVGFREAGRRRGLVRMTLELSG